MVTFAPRVSNGGALGGEQPQTDKDHKQILMSDNMNANNKSVLLGFEHPKEITDLDMAFGGKMSELLPPYDKLPEDFQRRRNSWTNMVDRWFFSGLPKDTPIVVKEGIDGQKALRHIKTIMSSFQPKHEHKTAGCAYLLSIWFQKFGDASH